MHDPSSQQLDMEGLSDTDSQSAQLLPGPYEKTNFDRQYERQSFWNRVRGGFVRWRWLILSGTQSVVIVLLLGSLLATNKVPKMVPGGELDGLVPEYPYEAKVFLDHISDYTVNFTSEAASLEIREKWRNLLPKGSGWIHVEKPEEHPYLLHSFTTSSAKDVYLLSWVHQLHCLYTVMDNFDALVQFGPDGTEREPETGHGSIHINHCFEYLRQIILCNMDSTLEGATVDNAHGTSGCCNAHRVHGIASSAMIEAMSYHLLTPSDKYLDGDSSSTTSSQMQDISGLLAARRSLQRWKIASLASTTLLFGVCFLFLSSVREGLPVATIRPLQSPADEAPEILEWQPQVFKSNFHEDRTPWQGPPSDTVDKAWDDLYQNIGIVTVNKSLAAKLPDETIEVPGLDGQYVLGLGVFHQLHCLNMMRKSMYPERYGGTEGMSMENAEMIWNHLEHCVDQLRQVIMCYGDLSTVSWEWDEEGDVPVSKFGATRMCRNFDNIHKWATNRAFPGEEFNKYLRMTGHNTIGN
ncbi:hypothetical protein UA08_01095 [Talaromyces atroroseus]|uniref:Tat pathway signal sequence n=1 Tax=Talaromyces atroroseus TaxID=1441469 RepID=A0A225AQC2_TALAT|nr:hypothetical protein UA08_01095 [Talaromyces atroroseus]OKL63821.1 hypothetical protein UA08_01095 [Talaromyces atroroseus]